MRFLSTLLFALVAVAGVGTVSFLFGKSTRPSSEFFSSGPTTVTLQRLSELVSSKVEISDILVGEGHNYRGSWLIRGDALIAVNLEKAVILDAEKDFSRRRAKIVLPLPRVIQPRVDHERSFTWDVSRTVWISINGDQSRMRDEAMVHAQRLVAHAAASPEHIEAAKRQAETVIEGMYKALDWDVEIQWK